MKCRSIAVSRLSVALAILLLAAGAVLAAPSIVGPYVQNVGTEIATICWATVRGQATCAPTSASAWAGTVTAPAYEHHSITFKDLAPGTTYTYDVLADGTAAGKGSFTTMPEGDQPFTFAILSDTQGTGNKALEGVIKRLVTEKPTFVVSTGDTVSDGEDAAGWRYFFEVGADLMRNTPWYAALGNHDRHAQMYFDFWSLPGNEAYYSFDRGSAHFVVLDSPGLRWPENNQSESEALEAWEDEQNTAYMQRQLEWLKGDLAGAKEAKYIFVFFHHPLFTASRNRDEGAKQVQAFFGSLFQDNQVSAVFTGHDHHYHRAAKGGVPFVTAGIGGGRPREIQIKQPETIKAGQVSAYMEVAVDAAKATVKVIGVDGQLVDEIALKPRAVAQPAAK